MPLNDGYVISLLRSKGGLLGKHSISPRVVLFLNLHFSPFASHFLQVGFDHLKVKFSKRLMRE